MIDGIEIQFSKVVDDGQMAEERQWLVNYMCERLVPSFRDSLVLK